MRLFAYLDDAPRAGILDESGLLVRHVPAFDGGIDLALAEGRFGAAVDEARVVARGSEPDAVELAADLDPLPAIEFPGKIVCIGLNYRDHLAEQHLDTPPRPTLFAKFGNAIVGDGEPIVRPEGTHALDLEVELGVVIGRHARRVAAADAMDHVAGYVVINDVSARDWQGNRAALAPGERGDGQWLRAKGSDTFLPVGATFATSDEIEDPHDLGLRSWRIPGAGADRGRRLPMQAGTTADMVWRIPELIEFVSKAITLEPGDLIATGTPSGVGVFREPPVFLEPGDRARCEIEGIGWVENPVVDWSSIADGANARSES
jgi:2-keto-4-pentenoate hydratase/2-oxohepta-3-ene-1,7-dioic acid hydratase in catechol pathway